MAVFGFEEVREDMLQQTLDSDCPSVIVAGYLIYYQANRLRAVPLFSVVRRAKRETRKWPRA